MDFENKSSEDDTCCIVEKFIKDNATKMADYISSEEMIESIRPNDSSMYIYLINSIHHIDSYNFFDIHYFFSILIGIVKSIDNPKTILVNNVQKLIFNFELEFQNHVRLPFNAWGNRIE